MGEPPVAKPATGEPPVATRTANVLATGGLAVAAEEARAQRQERARRALALLDRTERLGREHGLDTRAFRRGKARYTAWAAGEEFDGARLARAGLPGPHGALDWFPEGLERYHGQKYEEARAACGRVLQQHEEHFWARYVRGLCAVRTERWVEAREDLTACARQNPSSVWPRLMRGFVASELGFRLAQHKDQAVLAAGEYATAEKDFDWALRQDGDPVVRYVGLANRGALHIRRGEFEKAVEDLREAVAVNPEGFQGYTNLSRAYQGLQRWDEALHALDRAIQLRPDWALLYDSRARLQLLRQDPAAARADFEQAIAREKDGQSIRLVENLAELGRLLQREGRYEAALARYNRALQLRPGFILVEPYRAETLLQLKRPREAGQALDHYLASKTAKPTVLVYKSRGLLHAEAGEVPAAIRMYTLALGHFPEDSSTRRLRGWLYLLNDAVPLALQDFEECVRQDPHSGDALAGRGTARLRQRLRVGPEAAERRQELLDGAIADAEEAERQGPVTDRLLYNLARLYALAGAQLDADARAGRGREAAKLSARFADRSLAYLRRTLEMVPPERRAQFWRDQVQADPALKGLPRGTAYFQLEERYGRPGL
jgi:tetratricopeptide (TPR) repeat protein